MNEAALRLRGRNGPLHAQISWPEDAEPEAIVVIIGDATPPADTPAAVTLRALFTVAPFVRHG